MFRYFLINLKAKKYFLQNYMVNCFIFSFEISFCINILFTLEIGTFFCSLVKSYYEKISNFKAVLFYSKCIYLKFFLINSNLFFVGFRLNLIFKNIYYIIRCRFFSCSNNKDILYLIDILDFGFYFGNVKFVLNFCYKVFTFHIGAKKINIF